MSQSRKLLPLACLVLLLAGCGGVPPHVEPEVPPEVQRTELLLAEGRYLEAAESYARLSSAAESPLREHYGLRAAEALLDGGDTARARAIIDSLAVEKLTGEDRPRRLILLAQTALYEGQPLASLELNPGTVETLPPGLARRSHWVRALALEQLGRFRDAAGARVRLEPYLDLATERDENRRSTWNALSRASPGELSQPAGEPILEGWVDLARIARRAMADPPTLERQLAEWSQRYPAHPAQGTILSELISASVTGAKAPSHVALLLPFDGQFANASSAVRDGFLAAWFDDIGNPARPTISIWNTSDRDVWTTYLAAVEDGADFVVGPLEKLGVDVLAKAAPLPVDTLALNRVEEASSEGLDPAKPVGPSDQMSNLAEPGQPAVTYSAGPPPTGALYQMALSPEGEAQRVAERAWFDGHTSAAVLSPEGDWGERVTGAFVTAFANLGGLVATQRSYPNRPTDMSASVEALLAVDQSTERAQSLQRLLGRELNHVPRRREDVGFVFLAAFPSQARQLRPQLKFHHASDVPVYATSHIYPGFSDPTANIDLDGVIFGDMPWVLFDAGAHGRLKPQLQRIRGDAALKFGRLYAFGVDAYSILPRLGRLRAQSQTEYAGETGWLSVDGQAIIKRRLTWAQFIDGLAQPTELGRTWE